MLQHRAIVLPEETRNRIAGCHDVDTLERWLDRSFTASSADELFAQEDAG
jgi:hypothetical protein